MNISDHACAYERTLRGDQLGQLALAAESCAWCTVTNRCNRGAAAAMA